jgi:saccharopine dehydrogenase-like NADP-dependent oxidoreductase
MRVAVLGAGGTIAPAIVRDLSDTPGIDGLTLLDLDGDRARAVAERHGGGIATGAAVDARDRQALTLAIEGHGVLLNAASYRCNPAAMDAALAANANYIDLGGLYHVTLQQLRLHEAFAAAGLLAVLGCGAGPGKTNVMAARAARELEVVDEVRCASAGYDEAPPAGLAVPYALQTLLDELTEPPVVVRDGAPVPLAPLTAGGTVRFPEPIGERATIHTLHSEVATLPASLGAAACDFRLALAPAVEAALRDVVARGTPAHEVATVPGSDRTWSAQHVAVRGRHHDGAPATITITALTAPHEGWGLGGGIVSTATVASATARLLAHGALGAVAGVLPAERVLTPELLFPELEARGCVITMSIDSTNEVPTP